MSNNVGVDARFVFDSDGNHLGNVNTNIGDMTKITGDIATNISNNVAGLADMAHKSYLKINVKDNSVKGDGVTDDTTAIQTLINNNDQKTLYFPKGTYLISQPLSITNNVSLELDGEAEIRATVAMTSLLTYNISYTESVKRHIKGGIWNGNGFANICLNLIGFAQLTVGELLIKNPLQKGIYSGSDGVSGGGTSFGLYAHDLDFSNTLSFSVNPSVIGIHHTTSDCVFDSITMKDYTVGMQVTQGANRIENFHP